jgi:hypothetical protein
MFSYLSFNRRIIAVKKFPLDYDVFYSPALKHTRFDTQDGVPYPYYPGWETKANVIGCGKSERGRLYDFMSPAPAPSSSPAISQRDYVHEEHDHHVEVDDDHDMEPLRLEPLRLEEGPFFVETYADKENSGLQNVTFEKDLREGETKSENILGEYGVTSEETLSLYSQYDVEKYAGTHFKTVREVEKASNSTEVADSSTSEERIENSSSIAEETEATTATPTTSTTNKITTSASSNQITKPSTKKPKKKSASKMTNFGRKRRAADPAAAAKKCKTHPEDCIMAQFEVIGNDINVIPFNKEFDDCTTKNTEGVECPPGPFSCKMSAEKRNNSKLWIESRKQITEKQMCDACLFPDDSEDYFRETSAVPPDTPKPPIRPPTRGKEQLPIGIAIPYIIEPPVRQNKTKTPKLKGNVTDIPDGYLLGFDRLIIYRNLVSPYIGNSLYWHVFREEVEILLYRPTGEHSIPRVGYDIRMVCAGPDRELYSSLFQRKRRDEG